MYFAKEQMLFYAMVAFIFGLCFGIFISFIAHQTFFSPDTLNMKCTNADQTKQSFITNVDYEHAVLISSLAKSQGYYCNVNEFGIQKEATS